MGNKALSTYIEKNFHILSTRLKRLKVVIERDCELIGLTDKPEDKFFKRVMNNGGQVLLDSLGIPHKIKQPLPTEKIGPNWKNLLYDFVFLSEDNIKVILEFMSGYRSPKKDKQLIKYILVSYFDDDGEYDIELYIISNAEDSAELEFDFISGVKIPYKVLSFKDTDGDKLLKEIEDRIKRGEEFVKEDIYQIALIPFMRSKLSEFEIIKKICSFESDMKIDEDLKSDLKDLESILVEIFVKNEKKSKELMDMIYMQDTAFHRFFRDYENKIKEESLAEGEHNKAIEIALRMLRINLPIDKISLCTGLTVNQIESLNRSK